MRTIPYGRQSISQADIDAVVEALKSDYLTQGPRVEQFENLFAEYVGAKFAVAVSSGTSALHVAALALKIQPGDAVIVPAITFAATSNAVLYCGGTPVFADIDPETGCISLASARKALELIRKEGLRPRAIFPVHFAGRPTDLRALREFAAAERLQIVEDACHALGAEYRLSEKEPFRKIGSGGASSMVCWSYHPVKHIATGEGGAVTTDDPELAKALRMLRTHGITKNSDDFQHPEGGLPGRPDGAGPWYHEMQILGYNYRLCEIQAALGLSQMQKIESFVTRRRAIASSYFSALKDVKGLTLPAGDGPHERHSYHLFPVRIDYPAVRKTRTAVMAELLSKHVGTQVHYVPVYCHPYYRNNADRWRKVSCPEAERFYEQELSIPVFPAMSDADVEHVASTIRKTLG